ncbi:MAG: hypothetical protein ACTSWQ_04440, partial [Candidatus Thorarchaeota archaeon]
RWDDTKGCFKDANFDNKADERGDGTNNPKKTDFYPPRTNFLPLSSGLNDNSEPIPIAKDQNGDWITNDFKLAYFIKDQEPSNNGLVDCGNIAATATDSCSGVKQTYIGVFNRNSNPYDPATNYPTDTISPISTLCGTEKVVCTDMFSVNPIDMDDDFIYDVAFFSEDNIFNLEEVDTFSLRIDRKNPIIEGWNDETESFNRNIYSLVRDYEKGENSRLSITILADDLVICENSITGTTESQYDGLSSEAIADLESIQLMNWASYNEITAYGGGLTPDTLFTTAAGTYSRAWTYSYGDLLDDTNGLADGVYTYTVHCTDMAGNVKIMGDQVRVDGDITTHAPYPQYRIDNEDGIISLSISTTNEATCGYKLIGTGFGAVPTTGDHLSMTLTSSPDPSNSADLSPYLFSDLLDLQAIVTAYGISSIDTKWMFDVECVFQVDSGKISNEQIVFTMDRLNPVMVVYEDPNKETQSDLDDWRGNDPLYIECLDSPNGGFGCKELRFCTVRGEENECTLGDDDPITIASFNDKNLAVVPGQEGITIPPYPHTFCYQLFEKTELNEDPAFAGIKKSSLRYPRTYSFGNKPPHTSGCEYIQVDDVRPELLIKDLTAELVTNGVYPTDHSPYTIEGELIDWSYYMPDNKKLEGKIAYTPEFLEGWTFSDFRMRGTLTNDADERTNMDVVFKYVNDNDKYVARIDQDANEILIFKNTLSNTLVSLPNLDIRDISYEIELIVNSEGGQTYISFEAMDLGFIDVFIEEDTEFGQLGVRGPLPGIELSKLRVRDPTIPIENRIKWTVTEIETAAGEFEFFDEEILDKTEPLVPFDITGTEEGLYSVNIRAYDKANNMHFSPHHNVDKLNPETPEPYYFYLDTEPPSFENPNILDIEYGWEMEFDITIIESAALDENVGSNYAVVNVTEASITINGPVSRTLDLIFAGDEVSNVLDRKEHAEWTATLPPDLPLGEYDMDITAVDMFGHSNTTTFYFEDGHGFLIKDKQRPTFVLDDPSVDDFGKWVTGTNTVTLTGTYTELLPVSFEVVIVGEDPLTQTISIPITFNDGSNDVPFFTTFDLYPGKNVIHVEMMDEGELLESNPDPTKSKSVTIFYDTLPPEGEEDGKKIIKEQGTYDNKLNRKVGDYPLIEYGHNISILAEFDDPDWTDIITDITMTITGPDGKSFTTITESKSDFFEDEYYLDYLLEAVENPILQNTYNIPTGNYTVNFAAHDYYGNEYSQDFLFEVVDTTPASLSVTILDETVATTTVTNGKSYTKNYLVLISSDEPLGDINKFGFHFSGCDAYLNPPFNDPEKVNNDAYLWSSEIWLLNGVTCLEDKEGDATFVIEGEDHNGNLFDSDSLDETRTFFIDTLGPDTPKFFEYKKPHDVKTYYTTNADFFGYGYTPDKNDPAGGYPVSVNYGGTIQSDAGTFDTLSELDNPYIEQGDVREDSLAGTDKVYLNANKDGFFTAERFLGPDEWLSNKEDYTYYDIASSQYLTDSTHRTEVILAEPLQKDVSQSDKAYTFDYLKPTGWFAYEHTYPTEGSLYFYAFAYDAYANPSIKAGEDPEVFHVILDQTSPTIVIEPGDGTITADDLASIKLTLTDANAKVDCTSLEVRVNYSDIFDPGTIAKKCTPDLS